MTTETIGTCEKHQLPLDVHGECQLCRLSQVPSQTPPSRGGRWVVMTLIALVAGATTWGIASLSPDEAPAPIRGVQNTGARAVLPAVQETALADRLPEPALPSPDPALAPSSDSAATDDGSAQEGREGQTEEVDGQAHEWAEARRKVRIDMFATTSCDACDQAREYMQRNAITFTEHDIDEDEVANRRVRELSPERSVPTFEIDDMVFKGFSPDDFEATRTQAARKHLAKNPI